MGVKNVVRITKKRDIPSIPIVQLIFEEGIQGKTSTNWNCAVDRSNPIHKKIESKKVIMDIVSANLLTKLIFEINNNEIEPIKGSIITESSK
jgi:hypothetical protein